MKRAKGFTLVEVMVVVVIVAILVSVVLPSYSDYVKRGKITEATSNLSALRVNMEQYYQDNRTYLNGAVCGIGATPSATSFFNYACVATATTYTITATGQTSMAGFTYTVDQANTKQTTAAPAGWGVPPTANCWVTKQAGLC